MKKPNPPSQIESVRLKELLREVGVPIRQLPEILSLSAEECLQWWSGRLDLRVKPAHFGRLSHLLSIDENALFNGGYDKHLARSRLFSDKLILPERYEENKNSFVRASAHIIRYITLTRGQWFADQVLVELNVSPLIYQNVDMRINLTYFADLLEILERRGFTPAEMDTLSSVMFLSLRETALGRQFAGGTNYEEAYRVIANNFHLFDSNFECQSRFVGKKYLLKTTLPLQGHQAVGRDAMAQRRLLRYRHLALAWIPYLAGLTPLFPSSELTLGRDTVVAQYEFELEKKSMRRPLELISSN